jgi:hypothetical protein
MNTITREELRAMYPPPAGPTHAELEAVDLLVACAERDTGQSRKCRAFLLAWWNSESFGGFDLTDLWGLDDDLSHACVVVFGLVARWNSYPTSLPGGRGDRIGAIAQDVWESRNRADQ